MLQQIKDTEKLLLEELELCSTVEQLKDIRLKYLGRRGIVPEILRQIGELPPSERPSVGKAAGRLKELAESSLETKNFALGKKDAKIERFFDLSLPGRTPFYGKKHPITIVIEETVEIFHGMGFSVAEGPEVESEYYNFDALNTPPDHPARDLRDTFYIKPGTLLRTETSNVQIRVMEKMKPPVRIISPGRIYRNDPIDATHFPIFHQVEGLYVDKGVTFGDLKGTLTTFFKKMFGEDIVLRLVPHFFPFTEPSAEPHITCVFCRGEGCRVCKNTGWVELGGCGMVDPAVFENVGYDPEVYTGFAFGWGLERIAQLKFSIDSIRLFWENDLRFIQQF